MSRNPLIILTATTASFLTFTVMAQDNYRPTYQVGYEGVIMVDDLGVSVGSTNFHDRSFRLNNEANLNTYDATFAAAQVKVFEEDKNHSRRMTRAEFKHRSAAGKRLDDVAGTLRHR